MQVPHERIDIRPVELKNIIKLQMQYSDGRKVTSRNVELDSKEISDLFNQGFSNILVEFTIGSIALRFTKKDELLIHRESGERSQDLSHDRVKSRLLDPSDPFLIEVGISDHKGVIKPSRQDKYKQVEEFLRLLSPTLTSAISAGHIHTPTVSTPLEIVDLGCGHAYLTFAAHQYFKNQGLPVKVTGIDVRPDSRLRNSNIAANLEISSTIEFKAQEIADIPISNVDVVIALHACDTATDDAIAWAVNSNAKLLLIAPCCHHDLQSQIKEAPEPWAMMTKHGLMKERLVDLITDSIRCQILKILGYRVEAIEFIGGEHTPRNLMIRAVKTSAAPDEIDILRYKEMLALWQVQPALASRLTEKLREI
ncbi:MAG: methyltransferase [Actinobacteria bacterium]|nr:methyltransferase [Actinomycetota bacterium]